MAKKEPAIMRRLVSEERELKASYLQNGFYAFPRLTDNQEFDYLVWDVYILGSSETPYEETVLKARINIPPDYPMKPPSMQFVSRMFHPNIYENGNVCISTLQTMNDILPRDPAAQDGLWTPVHGIRSIVISVISLINEANIFSPANIDASKMYRDNYEEYKKVVRKLALKENKKNELDNVLKWRQKNEDEIRKSMRFG